MARSENNIVAFRKGGFMKVSENFKQYLEMERKHKQDWIDQKKAKCDAKIALHKKHNNEWVDFSKKYIDRLEKGEQAENFLIDKLNNVIKLHEEQSRERAELHEINHKKCLEIQEKHKKELEAFKKTLS